MRNFAPATLRTPIARRIADLEGRAETGDAEAARRFERVQAILDRARMAVGGDS